jgi:hypothetical protein
LDWLTIVTQLRFEIVGAKLAMEWEIGKTDREFIAFATTDPRWPPSPELNINHTASAQRLINAKFPPFLEVASRAFRVGVRERSPEDQFQSFWTALEAVVEGTKQKAKVAVTCNQCRTPLTCPACNTAQVKTPMATQAIAQRINQVMGEERGDGTFRALLYLRNRLTHGGSLLIAEQELQQKHNFTLDQCVEITARLAHGAITEAARPHLPGDEPIMVWVPDQFVIGELQAKFAGEIKHEGAGDHPEPPEFNIEVNTSFTPLDGRPRAIPVPERPGPRG